MKIIAENRKAYFNYFILEEIEAGIILTGSEVKSIRAGKVNISDSHADEKDNTIYLLNSNISEYHGANRFNHEPRRPRKLLLHKKEIGKLIGKVQTKGLSLVPLSLYFNEKNKVKIKLALVKGKKLHDKRASIKEKDERRAEARQSEY